MPLVLVVGNLTVGGSGKTPIVMSLVHWAKARGIRVGVISRGYARRDTNLQVCCGETAFVDAHHETRQSNASYWLPLLGDEPLWMAMACRCTVAVHAKRAVALQGLIAAQADVEFVIADDGLQHSGLIRHMEWAVFDARGVGNGRLLPLGPLRETVQRLQTVDAVLYNGLSAPELPYGLNDLADDVRPHMTRSFWLQPNITGFLHWQTGVRISVCDALKKWGHVKQDDNHNQTLSITAFAGLGHPQRFFKALAKLGFQCQTIAFPDHHNYRHDTCHNLLGDVLICTGKDAVKCDANEARLWVAEVAVDLPAQLTDTIEHALHHRHSRTICINQTAG